MGVLNKLKNIFYDEVVVDEDEVKEEDELNKISKINKIVRREPKEIDNPKIEEIKFQTIEEEPIKEQLSQKNESTFSERELFKSERTFNFVDFTDEEEKELPKRNVLSDASRNVKSETPEVVQPKVFKQSPIISPVWGILDKDYKKEEIKEKSTTTTNNLKTSTTTYDSVRRKAYGTLEDELEDTLNSMNKISTNAIKKEINKVDKDVELLEQKTSKIEDLISKIEDATNEINKDKTIGELEDSVELDNFEDEKDSSDKTLTDNTLEHDLFNLIDSMYDEEE